MDGAQESLKARQARTLQSEEQAKLQYPAASMRAPAPELNSCSTQSSMLFCARKP